VIEFIVIGIIGVIVYIANQESKAKDKKIRELQEENNKYYKEEFNKRFKNVYGVSFDEAYNDPTNRKRWDEWGDRVRNGKTHWQPNFDSYIHDGFFSKDESKHLLRFMDDAVYEDFINKE